MEDKDQQYEFVRIIVPREKAESIANLVDEIATRRSQQWIFHTVLADEKNAALCAEEVDKALAKLTDELEVQELV